MCSKLFLTAIFVLPFGFSLPAIANVPVTIAQTPQTQRIQGLGRLSQHLEENPQLLEQVKQLIESNPQLVVQMVEDLLQKNPQVVEQLQQSPDVVEGIASQSPLIRQSLEENPALVEQLRDLIENFNPSPSS